MYRLRMERAVGLLLNTDLKIAEASSQLVFFTVSHFIKVFKKHFGRTPQEYRTNP